MSVFDWSEFDDFDDEEYLAYMDEMHPGADDVYGVYDPFSGLFTIVERIREYTHDTDDLDSRYTPDVAREIEAVQAYIESGITQFERLLENHAAFDAWLAERSEDVA